MGGTLAGEEGTFPVGQLPRPSRCLGHLLHVPLDGLDIGLNLLLLLAAVQSRQTPEGANGVAHTLAFARFRISRGGTRQ